MRKAGLFVVTTIVLAACSGASGRGAQAPQGDPEVAAAVDASAREHVEQSKLALSRAANPAVRSLAAEMLANHEENRDKLRDLGFLSRTGSGSQQPVGSAAGGAAAPEELMRKRGSEFDRVYLDAEIKQHEEAIEELDEKWLPGVRDTRLRAFLERIRPQLERHIEHAREVRRSVEETR